MGKFQSLLNLRLKQKPVEKNKLTTLAERSNSGNLSSFSGVFRVNSLQDEDVQKIEDILEEFKEAEDQNISQDLSTLTTLTAEVRAITNQAVILHGERIKKAQNILIQYRDGAFTAWLMAAYGNRQTPYNFLQYYEFYMSMPVHLHPKIDEMPRQAVYSLASRSGEQNQKEEIVEKYFFEPKANLLQIIRKTFPLPEKDKRKINYPKQAFSLVKKLQQTVSDEDFTPTKREKDEMVKRLKEILFLLEDH